MPTNAKKIRIGGVSHDIEDTQARTDISALKSATTLIESKTLYKKWTTNNYTEHPNFSTGYINADGSSAGGTSYSHTERISVQSGDIIVYYFNDVATVTRSYVCYVNGTADSTKGTTSASQSSFTVPDGVTEIVVNTWADSANGYFTVQSAKEEYEIAFDDKLQTQMDLTQVPVNTTASGWNLFKNGLCYQDAQFKLVKFAVESNALYRVTYDGLAQFQTVASVPSSGTPNRTGGTYQEDDCVILAPNDATYLIVSTAVANTPTCYKVENVIDTVLTENGDGWEV